MNNPQLHIMTAPVSLSLYSLPSSTLSTPSRPQFHAPIIFPGGYPTLHSFHPASRDGSATSHHPEMLPSIGEFRINMHLALRNLNLNGSTKRKCHNLICARHVAFDWKLRPFPPEPSQIYAPPENRSRAAWGIKVCSFQESAGRKANGK